MMMRPLVRRRVNPNHVTTARLAVGMLAMAGFCAGGYLWTNIGALLFVLSNLLDHADGELARMTGQQSRFGHVYDLASDALIHVLLFVAIGVGMIDGVQDQLEITMGVIAGVSISLIFVLRMIIEERLGKTGTRQPGIAGFEAEDVLYLVPVITLADALHPFLVAAAIGAPIFCLWVVSEWLRSGRAVSEVPRT